MTFDQAVELLSRDERFKATVYTMNTLLVQKGVYTQEEFDHYFCQWAQNHAANSNGSGEAHSQKPVSV